MIRPVIKFVVLGVFLTALLLTLPALTQVLAQTGMGGGAGAGASGAGAGGAGAGASGAGAGGAGAGAGAGGGYGGGFIYHPDQDSSYASTQPGWSYATKSLGTKATKKHRKAMQGGTMRFTR
jgi:hypothetical protein